MFAAGTVRVTHWLSFNSMSSTVACRFWTVESIWRAHKSEVVRPMWRSPHGAHRIAIRGD